MQEANDNTVFGQSTVFEFSMSKGHDYSHLFLGLREETEADFYSFFSEWRNSITITSQIDKDATKVYAVDLGAKLTLSNSAKLTTAFSKIDRKAKKYLESNPRPITFGQYVFMIGKAAGIKEIIFRDFPENEGKERYRRETLKDGCQRIDWLVSNEFPHITDQVSYGYLS